MEFVCETLRFKNVFHPHENGKPAFFNSSFFKIVLEKLRGFRDGLVFKLTKPFILLYCQCDIYTGVDPGEVKWVNFHPPFSEPLPIFFFLSLKY